MFIIASKPGQLGNRLYIFAHFIGCAIENGFRVMNPAFDEYANYFRGTRQDLFCRFPPRKSRLPGAQIVRRLLYKASYYLARLLVRARLESKYAKAVALEWEEELDLSAPAFLETARRHRLIFFQGWQFRDPKSLKKHAAAVRSFLRPVAELEKKIAALVASARTQGDVLIGLHMRRGDYRTFMGGQYFYEPDVYASVCEKIKELFPGRSVVFIVCSDEPLDKTVFSRLNYTPGGGHFVEDMYTLAECDYIVGPPSTYTMWASFYGAAPLYMLRDPDETPAPESFIVQGIDNVE